MKKDPDYQKIIQTLRNQIEAELRRLLRSLDDVISTLPPSQTPDAPPTSQPSTDAPLETDPPAESGSSRT